MNKLNNVEFMLLQILCDSGELSGYEINQLVEERNYRQWADIGTTSIYVSLEKLQKKDLVESYIDIKKQGKGPLPKKFKISDTGRQCLGEAIKEALSETRERDKRFDLGIAASHLIDKEEVLHSLARRIAFLLKVNDELKAKVQRDKIQNYPANIRFLFSHPVYLIECEIAFLEDFINTLKEEKSK